MKWIPGTQTQVAQTGEDKMVRYICTGNDSLVKRTWHQILQGVVIYLIPVQKFDLFLGFRQGLHASTAHITS